MFNPFRKNAKKLDLTPSLWEKIRLRAYMAWVAARVLSSRIPWLAILIPTLILGVFAVAIVFAHRHDVAAQQHFETAPCSAFANQTMDHVPLRCLPNSIR